MKINLIFATVIAAASANAVGRSGWGSGAGSSLPPYTLGLDIASAASGQGTAQANQQVAAVGLGNGQGLSSLVNFNGIYAGLEQGSAFQQLAVAGQGATSTINEEVSQQSAVATDTLQAVLTAPELAQIQNSAGTDAVGTGELGMAATTYNEADFSSETLGASHQQQ